MERQVPLLVTYRPSLGRELFINQPILSILGSSVADTYRRAIA
jgi:hypothetical protein